MRRLRDAQTVEEVVLVFAVAISREIDATCAVYAFEENRASRRALRSVDAARSGVTGRIDALHLAPLLNEGLIAYPDRLPQEERTALFGANDGVLTSLHVDGTLWGFALFSAVPNVIDWHDRARNTYLRTLASHLELAVTSARGFERISDLARELAQSNEFKDDLLAMLAHDFKGPLTVILGYCELLLENPIVTDREELEMIFAQTKRLVRLSDDALTLAQTQAGKFRLDRVQLDLREFVAESVKAHNRSDERLRLENPAEPVPVSIDTARFNHVLDNLFMNALKYSEGDVDVRVASSTTAKSGSTGARGGAATISISDSGIGIPAAELGAVFSRFGRASNARRMGISGSGVGLYVSRKIVEVHGGSVSVTSLEGEGSTFTITLPLTPEQLFS